MTQLIPTVIVGSSDMLTLEEFCQALHSSKELVIEMVEHELVRPEGKMGEEWRFDSISLRRGRIAVSFYRELEINMPGIALALDLLDKIEELQQQMQAK